MTVNEAIKELKMILEEATEDENSVCYVTSCDKEPLEMAIKSLEKQVPKKTTHEATLYKCNTCPSCKNVLDRFEYLGDKKCLITTKYCCFCGQKLDW